MISSADFIITSKNEKLFEQEKKLKKKKIKFIIQIHLSKIPLLCYLKMISEEKRMITHHLVFVLNTNNQ
jgi:hypothetical protein